MNLTINQSDGWWIVKRGETKLFFSSEAELVKYVREERAREETSFLRKLYLLYVELDHTKYKWKEGVGIVEVET